MNRTRSMKRLIWALILLAAIPSTAQASGPAAGSPGPSEGGIPVGKIEKALKSYADAVGCRFRFDATNIVELDIADGRSMRRYVALFFLDTGCTGGSAMGNSMFAVLDWSDDGRGNIFVQPELSQPAIPSFGFPQFIDRIFLKGHQLWYSGVDYDFSKDALCCPSVPVEGQVVLREGLVHVDTKQNFGARYWFSIPKH